MGCIVDLDYSSLGYFWAAVLGVVQGVAEFLPISSSGHLALVEHLGMGMAAPVSFDIFLHLATLLVVFAYFWRRILWYLRNDVRVLLYVVAASVPTGLVGLLLRDYFEVLRHSPIMICVGLLITAAALAAAEMRQGAGYQLRDLGWFGAVTLGFCQSLALVPGISRSGMTIAGGMICGVDREEAFNFSFILSIPAVLGAVMLETLSAVKTIGIGAFVSSLVSGPLLVGFVLAAGCGYMSLRLLDRIVVSGRLMLFSVYCCLVAMIGLVYFTFFA